MTKDLVEIMADLKMVTSEMVVLRQEIHIFKESLESLAKIVRGNGTAPSLLISVALLDRDVKHIVSALNEGKIKFQEIEDEFVTKLDTTERRMERKFDSLARDFNGKTDTIHKKVEDSKNTKIMIAISIISGLFGVIGALISILKS